LVGVLLLLLMGAGIGLLKYNDLRDAYYFRVVMQGAALSVQQERALQPKDEFAECKNGCPAMVVVPAGRFVMGSPESEKNSYSSPQHEVTIPKHFAVGKFDVIVANWNACVAAGACTSASGYGPETRAVKDASWDEAEAYVTWLSRVTGKQYRLLTEAEWEYGARAGTTTRYYWGDNLETVNADCFQCGPQGDNKGPNPFGLYDIHGYVLQWVEDCYHGDYTGAPSDGSAWTDGDCRLHVYRGSSAASRGFMNSTFRSGIGLRLGRTLAQ
jgi:formylglycine-generating enzyme required for sulfatase activity